MCLVQMEQEQEQSEAQSQSFCSKPDKNTFNRSKKSQRNLKPSWERGICQPHLLPLQVLYAAYKRQIEADSKTVLEEERGSATVQLSFGDDGDAVTQEVGLIHVVGGQNHGPVCSSNTTFNGVPLIDISIRGTSQPIVHE